MAAAAVLDAPLTLADAQAVAAVQNGLATWQALRGGSHVMEQPARPDGDRPAMLGAEPLLFVRDMPVAIDFYTRCLGFAVAFTYGEPPYFGQVTRDAARLNLRCTATPVLDPERAAAEDLLAAIITLDDARPLFQTWLEAGVPFHQRLRREPWGAGTFIVRDPDGNLLLFAGR